MALLSDTISERDILADCLDTDQLEILALDTGQQVNALALPTGAHLTVTRHEIHRTDQLADSGEELITSTLKFFQLEVALLDEDDLPITHADGCHVHATLLYENGQVAEEMSVSLEPPLLGGDAVLEGGSALFRMRITILTSLCNAKKFRLHVALVDNPDIFVSTDAVKTITKLRRASRGGAAAAKAAAAEADAAEEALFTALKAPPSSPLTVPATAASQKPAPSAKRALSASAEKGREPKSGASKEAVGSSKEVLSCAFMANAIGRGASDCATATQGSRTLSSLWDEVASNGEKLRQLQEQQRELFGELRRMRAAAAERNSQLKAVAPSASLALAV